MKDNDPVKNFTKDVRRRLNRHRLWDVLVWCGAVGSGIMIGVGGFYIFRGHRVNLLWYLATLLVVGVASGVWWLVRRHNIKSAAKHADKFFNLKDSITSYLGFKSQGKKGRFHELQAEQTNKILSALYIDRIQWQLPKRVITVGTVLLVVAVAMGFKGESQEIKIQRLLEEQTALMTEEINEELAKTVEEILEDTIDEMLDLPDDKELAELLNPNELKELVKELAETKDIKEAMRQYAKMEGKLKGMSARLMQRKEERLLDEVGKELSKERQSKELGKELTKKDYRKSAEKLEELKHDASKELSEQRKELAKLKATAKRMATACKAANRKSGNNSKSGGQDNMKSNNSQGSSSLSESIEELDEMVSKLDEALEQAERETRQNGDPSKECKDNCGSCSSNANKSLDKLGKKLKRMAAKRKAQSRIKKLSDKLGQCQSSLCQGKKQCQKQGNKQGNKPGGNKAGTGSSDAKNDLPTEDLENGELSQLKGTKGAGPSQTMVEEAEDGTGVSSSGGSAIKRTYQKQVESFVQRQDVPENVKAGVKAYFENIHETEKGN
jgi:hypothetical protein